MYFGLRIVLAALIAATPLLAAADKPVTVAQTIALVRAALAARQDDKQIAKSLSKLTLVERLDTFVVERLESEGAGPLTVEELARFVDLTSDFQSPAPPPSFPNPPVPSREAMTAAIHHARLYAFSYSDNLPNFLCEENIVRYENLRGRQGWNKRDTLSIRLSYEDQKEHNRLVTYNGRPTSRSLSDLGGAQTSGEFGALMIQILDPVSKGKFRWDHWTLLRKRPAQVYSYRIDAADSHYTLLFGDASGRNETIPAMEGFLYLDGETNDIVRIANHAADIDIRFPVRLAATVLDYAAQTVGAKSYILPIRSETRLATADIHTRNMVEFTGYRKFQGESTITFGDPEPPPDPKIKH